MQSQVQRQLNPELFGEAVVPARMVENTQSAVISSQALLAIEQKLADNRRQVQVMSEQLIKVVGQVNEFIKTSNSKFEKAFHFLQKLEQNDQAISLEASQKISLLHSRLVERKTMDMKIQDMVDRHHAVLRSFESKITQLQRLVSEKEAQCISAQAALNDAKSEIAKLKRM